MSEQFLIEKRGYYYRPNAKGYTAIKSEAGRYSFEEAAEYAGPNGPDGSQDGIGIWRESEAPEYASACCATKLQYQNRELVEALQNTLGHINTPISRRKLGIKDQWPEWLTQAVEVLAKAEGKSPNNQTDGVAKL